jgi:hypothetical protein
MIPLSGIEVYDKLARIELLDCKLPAQRHGEAWLNHY